MIDLVPSLTWASEITNFTFEDSVTYVKRNSNHLIITAGDSWTYGDSLESNIRLKQIYGNLISEQLNADFLNIGFKGWSNSWILNYTNWLLLNQKEQLLNYKKITLIVTLTENARDVTAPHSFPYNYIDGYRTHGATQKFYQTILDDIKQNWCKLLDQIKSHSNIDLLVTSNFVWHNIEHTKKNWIEVIAEHANYKLPVRTNMVTGWIFDTFATVNEICEIKKLDTYKEFVLPYIEQANKVNKWLDASDYNSKKASKHPDYRGHKIWADYLLNYMEKNYEMV